MFYIAVYKDRGVSFPYNSLDKLHKHHSHMSDKIHSVVEADTKDDLAPKVRKVLKCIPKS